MQLNLGAIFLAFLGVMVAASSARVQAQPHHHRGPIFDTRPSPFNPNAPGPSPPYRG
ncbi:metchnikowin [Drosophila bipectinata]|uniref:metchnikowin n=1 Tax=Drosophila bipectinata TaxID=42026 RepID=UPI0007E766F8|nr:metchnikowin [Drosophila bipectinata]